MRHKLESAVLRVTTLQYLSLNLKKQIVCFNKSQEAEIHQFHTFSLSAHCVSVPPPFHTPSSHFSGLPRILSRRCSLSPHFLSPPQSFSQFFFLFRFCLIALSFFPVGRSLLQSLNRLSTSPHLNVLSLSPSPSFHISVTELLCVPLRPRLC